MTPAGYERNRAVSEKIDAGAKGWQRGPRTKIDGSTSGIGGQLFKRRFCRGAGDDLRIRKRTDAASMISVQMRNNDKLHGCRIETSNAHLLVYHAVASSHALHEEAHREPSILGHLLRKACVEHNKALGRMLDDEYWIRSPWPNIADYEP